MKSAILSNPPLANELFRAEHIARAIFLFLKIICDWFLMIFFHETSAPDLTRRFKISRLHHLSLELKLEVHVGFFALKIYFKTRLYKIFADFSERVFCCELKYAFSVLVSDTFPTSQIERLKIFQCVPTGDDIFEFFPFNCGSHVVLCICQNL